MAQMAQETDILVVGTTELTSDNKKYLIDCIKRGIIMDVNVQTKTGNVTTTSKVVGWSVDTTREDTPVYKVTIVNVTTGALTTVALQ